MKILRLVLAFALLSTATRAEENRYDLLGRTTLQSVATWNSGTSTWTKGDKVQTQYDAYGDISSKGVNGVYQDGALFIEYPQDRWRAFFFAVQSQSFDTDDKGNVVKK